MQNSKRKKVNPPAVAVYEEDDEKQQEEEDQNDQSAPEQIDNQIEIDNKMVENHVEQDEEDLSDFEDIFQPKRFRK